MLGWNPVHNPRHWDHLDGHDAAGDVFVTAHWHSLMMMYPDSKFVLNTRPFGDWLESLKRIPGFWESDRNFDRYYRRKVYRGAGSPSDGATLSRAWYDHHRQVTIAFRHSSQKNRLLSVSLPFEWKPLCEFLGVPVPDEPFPWLNRGHCDDAVVR